MENRLQILQRRKEIEQELVDLLEESGSNFSLDDVKDIGRKKSGISENGFLTLGYSPELAEG